MSDRETQLELVRCLDREFANGADADDVVDTTYTLQNQKENREARCIALLAGLGLSHAGSVAEPPEIDGYNRLNLNWPQRTKEASRLITPGASLFNQRRESVWPTTHTST